MIDPKGGLNRSGRARDIAQPAAQIAADLVRRRHQAGDPAYRRGQPPRCARLITINDRLKMASTTKQVFDLVLLLLQLLQAADKSAQPLVSDADRLRRRAAGGCLEELAGLSRNPVADTEYAEAMAVPELEMR